MAMTDKELAYLRDNLLRKLKPTYSECEAMLNEIDRLRARVKELEPLAAIGLNHCPGQMPCPGSTAACDVSNLREWNKE